MLLIHFVAGQWVWGFHATELNDKTRQHREQLQLRMVYGSTKPPGWENSHPPTSGSNPCPLISPILSLALTHSLTLSLCSLPLTLFLSLSLSSLFSLSPPPSRLSDTPLPKLLKNKPSANKDYVKIISEIPWPYHLRRVILVGETLVSLLITCH